ncbi:hypothetical protein V8G54_013817 [Vigna mungo]|uniref:Uncharacterized protein n=1 Tax=Vigna mungo TaxID=3915 RepID=A0AAQ3RWW5_VIGMU
MGAGHAMKRIPRIKFPQRHPNPSGNSLHTFPFLFSSAIRYPIRIHSDFIITKHKPNYDHLPAISRRRLTRFLNFAFRKIFSFVSGFRVVESITQLYNFLINFLAGSAPGTQALSSTTDGSLPSFTSSKAFITLGGKASLQPKRTPLSDEEIEAVLVCKIPCKVIHIFILPLSPLNVNQIFGPPLT